MSPATDWLTQLLLLALVLLLTTGIYFVVRVRYKARSAGAFNTAYRLEDHDHWSAGVCHYTGDLLKWYRIISLKWGSSCRWPRKSFEILETKTETVDGVTVSVLKCQADTEVFWLAMDPHDYHGVVSWMESSPPRLN